MGMQSASVLIDTPVAIKLPQTNNGAAGSAGGGVFDRELRQQQQQIGAERSSATKTIPENSEKRGETRPKTAVEGAQRQSSPAQTPAKSGAAKSAEAVANESKDEPGQTTATELATESDEMVNAAEIATGAGGDEAGSELVVAENIDATLLQIESPAADEPQQSASALLAEGDLAGTMGGNNLPPAGQQTDHQADQQDGHEPELSAAGTQEFKAKGELLPAIGQGDGSQVNASAIIDSVEETPATKLVSQAVSAQGNLLDKSMTTADGAEVVVKNSGVNSVSNTDDVAVQQAQAEIAQPTAPVAKTVTADVVSELAEQAAATVVSAVPTPRSQQNGPLDSNGLTSSAVNGIVNRLSGQSGQSGASANSGDGHPDSMAGRHNQITDGAGQPLAEVESSEPSDKATAFLAALKSISKEGATSGELRSAFQSGDKPAAPQLSQMVTPQLAAAQSSSQSQLAGAAVSSLSPTTAGATPAMMTIATSMRQQGWDRAMGERLVFMSRNGIQEAQIQVNPRQMGPIDIKVTVNQEQQAHVTFVTTNSTAREAIDAALPRLREMFDQAGLNLAESEVSQRDHQQSGRGEATDEQRDSEGIAAQDLEGAQDELSTLQVGYIRPAGLDLFA
jgi:flagellar hook-length control protein FliK